MYEFLERFNDDEEQMKFGSDMRKYELYVIVPYIIPIVFFIPYAIDKESDFCKFHSNQSLAWLIVISLLEAITGITLLFSAPISMFGYLINLLTFAIEVFLVIGAYKGYAIKIPVIGNFIKVFK